MIGNSIKITINQALMQHESLKSRHKHKPAEADKLHTCNKVASSDNLNSVNTHTICSEHRYQSMLLHM